MQEMRLEPEPNRLRITDASELFTEMQRMHLTATTVSVIIVL